MTWQNYYKDHCVTALEAVSKIKSGDRVVVGHAVGEPSFVIDAMIKNCEKLHDVEIVHMVCMGKAEYCKPEMASHFRHNAIFVGGLARDAIFEGRGDYTPCFFSEVPKMFTEGYLPVDVALIQVTPPDKHGYVSLGVSVDYTKAAATSAKITVAQVNERMPRTLGDSFLHVSEIDYFVEANAEIIELQPPTISKVEEEIGERCASLIEDGATLQLGIGSLPDAVLKFMGGKKDLGIHSEMFSDGVVDLIEAGVITNHKKTIHRDRAVVAFLMGTRKLYDFVDNNPMVFMAPVDYVNNPFIIAQNYKVVSINSCVQVDFMGQVASESIGNKQISGVGGQVDFVRGANLCPGGKSIIAIPSTAGNGKLSKIVPNLDLGSAVTTSRNEVCYIVTEYGIADLKGKTLRDRARALISIAHPDFRPQLVEEWEKRFKSKYS
jgi:4-hydroxybutyrate CoA-transferase